MLLIDDVPMERFAWGYAREPAAAAITTKAATATATARKSLYVPVATQRHLYYAEKVAALVEVGVAELSGVSGLAPC